MNHELLPPGYGKSSTLETRLFSPPSSSTQVNLCYENCCALAFLAASAKPGRPRRVMLMWGGERWVIGWLNGWFSPTIVNQQAPTCHHDPCNNLDIELSSLGKAKVVSIPNENIGASETCGLIESYHDLRCLRVPPWPWIVEAKASKQLTSQDAHQP